MDANPVELRIRRPPAQNAPQVDPLEQTVTRGSPARFRCWVPGKFRPSPRATNYSFKHEHVTL